MCKKGDIPLTLSNDIFSNVPMARPAVIVGIGYGPSCACCFILFRMPHLPSSSKINNPRGHLVETCSYAYNNSWLKMLYFYCMSFICQEAT